MRCLLILFLAGCATLPKVPETVLTPIAVTCIKESPAKPEFMTRDDFKNLNSADYVLMMTSEWLKQNSYIGELESVLSACK